MGGVSTKNLLFMTVVLTKKVHTYLLIHTSYVLVTGKSIKLDGKRQCTLVVVFTPY